MKLLTTALLLISDITIANDSLRQSQCKLEHKRITLSMKKRGDVILGGIMQMSTEISVIADGFYNMRKRPNEQICTIQSLHYLRHFLAFLYAVEEINKETDFLPNITLGFEIYDTCMAERKAVEVVLYMLTGQNAIVPNYRCNIERKVTAFIGHRMPSSTYSVAALLGLYRYPQISYGAMDHSINSRILYPSLFHTVPNEQIQFKAIILLLQHFGWNWVGIITSDNDHYLRSSLELQDAITKSGGCVEVLIPVSHAAGDKNITNITSSRVVETLTRSSCTVFIINSDESGFLSMLLALSKQFQIRKVFILPPHLPNVDINAYNHIFNGSLGVTVHKGNIPGLKEFLQRDHSELYNKSVLFRFVYFITIISFFPNDSWSQYKSYFSKLDPFVYDVYNFRITHRVYTAVYAVAHALHDMYLHRNHKLSSTGKPMDWQPWQINQYLRKVHFITPGGEEVNLDDKESALTKFDVINYHVLPNKSLRTMEVGHIYLNRSQNLQIKINDSKIKWGPAFTQIPRSVCTESCSPGFRKAPGKVRHKCCYECVPCSEGEISNSSDMENCLTCPEDQWPDIDRVLCIPRSIEFLSYQDPLGAAVTALAVSFSALTVTVLGIFINHRHTPIVKANNENLSYLLLISLMLCFLCSLLFIGRPVKITCLLRQAAFGIIFTVAISCVLSKTITVVIAFNALKPNSKLRKWLGNRIPACLVLLCTLGVGLICIVWWILSPPFPDTDTHTEQGKIILKCNEGSVTIFYTMVGYIGFLAILSFVVAFLARKLPDTFNEAQYITFSMLVFCSVWVSFIPAYLSTKGKYMVAMEVFAILASGAGLICCIFIPKCYIILIRPDLNTRTHVSK